MGLLNRLLGFRWSLYIVRNDNELAYVMHENSVLELIDYTIVGGFGKGLSPVEPWSLFINFNKKHQNIKLLPEHFVGENPSPALLQMIEDIDPKWRVKPGKAVFMEAATKKELQINSIDPEVPITSDYLEKMLEKINNGIEEPPTFFKIIHEVFGR